MATYKWALKQMREGKRVRRNEYAPNQYCFYLRPKREYNSGATEGAKLMGTNGWVDVIESMAETTATDWEVYEHKTRGGLKMEIDDMSTETIKKYLKGREQEFKAEELQIDSKLEWKKIGKSLWDSYNDMYNVKKLGSTAAYTMYIVTCGDNDSNPFIIKVYNEEE